MVREAMRSQAEPEQQAQRLPARLARELSRHPFAYGVVLAFALSGPLVVGWLFPEVSPLVGLVGGLVFGVYAALCAVPDKFFD